jgi:hypothetical protein
MCVRTRQQDLSHLGAKKKTMTAVVTHAGHAMPRKAQVAVATRRLRAGHSTPCCPVTPKTCEEPPLVVLTDMRVHLL